MKKACIVLYLGCLGASLLAEEIPNRLIDYGAFTSQVAAVGQLRSTRRVTEDEFIKMSREPETIVLDARSEQKYDLLHMKGAKHLSLPDMTAGELAKVIPSSSTRILIYCNNNFLNSPKAFPAKAPAASLNIHTINVLYAYGYANVFELGPLIDINKTKIPFEGSEVTSSD
jgi:hypothetical protein